MTGENGLAQGVIFLSNVLESWTSKLHTYVNGTGRINETEWLAFYSQMDEWLESINKSVNFVGKSTKDSGDDTNGEKKACGIKNM